MLCLTKNDHVKLVPNHSQLENYLGKEVNISLDKRGDINKCTVVEKIDGVSKQHDVLDRGITITQQNNSNDLKIEKKVDTKSNWN